MKLSINAMKESRVVLRTSSTGFEYWIGGGASFRYFERVQISAGILICVIMGGGGGRTIYISF